MRVCVCVAPTKSDANETMLYGCTNTTVQRSACVLCMCDCLLVFCHLFSHFRSLSLSLLIDGDQWKLYVARVSNAFACAVWIYVVLERGKFEDSSSAHR